MTSGKPQLLFATPFMRKQGEPLRNAEGLAFSLQKSYPEARVCMDPVSQQTGKNIDALSNLKVSASDIKVVITGASNPVPQGKTVINIAEELRNAHVEVRAFTGVERYQGESGKAVFVVTGHSSEELATLIRQLGETIRICLVP
jgi:hypothetical protein